MTNSCKLCNYETDNLYNFNTHCKSIKHIKKEKVTTYCYICNKEYSTRKKYLDHKNYKHKYSDKNTVKNSKKI